MDDPVVIMKALADLLTHVRMNNSCTGVIRWQDDADAAIDAAHKLIAEQTGERPALVNPRSYAPF